MQAEFEQAVEQVQPLIGGLKNDMLLKLYGLYKQATEGDVTGEKPGGFDFVGAAKWSAWAARRGMPTETAQREYIALVSSLPASGPKG